MRLIIPTMVRLMTTLNPALARVLKRLHYPLYVILTCVRWYVAYPLSFRHLEEMMPERAISVDHSTVHRWAIKVLPVLEKTFRRHKKAVRSELATGRNVYQGPSPVEVFVPSSRQGA
ncbi:hypothetical protein LMG27177_07544 [Paraburkholderia fynbosensis]|uniref:IS6 family transposase ISBmu21 n=1 Tax=Paraburkholderia fynbosensis TaxID=1200993 RepID=A0A6J5H8Y9_9BURK|nr:hypothetical protein LMG27177_07544 [Paraburkholderia fynbosensis]